MDGWIETSQNIFDRSQLRYNLTLSACPSYAKPIMSETKVVLRSRRNRGNVRKVEVREQLAWFSSTSNGKCAPQSRSF